MELIQKAIEAMKNSYSPYSKFRVGCAVELNNGKIITGTNIENVSYGLSMCAERVALFKVISEGFTKEDIKSMAIAGDTINPIAPCGACRQVMIELLDLDTKIYLTNLKSDVKEVTVRELMPYGFDKIE